LKKEGAKAPQRKQAPGPAASAAESPPSAPAGDASRPVEAAKPAERQDAPKAN